MVCIGVYPREPTRLRGRAAANCQQWRDHAFRWVENIHTPNPPKIESANCLEHKLIRF